MKLNLISSYDLRSLENGHSWWIKTSHIYIYDIYMIWYIYHYRCWKSPNFFNNSGYHPHMCVLGTLCGNIDKHGPFDIIYISYIWPDFVQRQPMRMSSTITFSLRGKTIPCMHRVHTRTNNFDPEWEPSLLCLRTYHECRCHRSLRH